MNIKQIAVKCRRLLGFIIRYCTNPEVREDYRAYRACIQWARSCDQYYNALDSSEESMGQMQDYYRRALQDAEDRVRRLALGSSDKRVRALLTEATKIAEAAFREGPRDA